MSNWKIAAGLGVTLLALGGIASWDEWQTKKDEKEKETSNLLIPIKPDQVKGIVFFNAGDAETGGDKEPAAAVDPAKAVSMSAQLIDGKWQIVKPVSEAADQQVIQDLIKNVTDYKFEKEIATSKDQWTQYGLATPRRSIELETTDGTKTTVYVGMNAPVGFSTYVATDKSEIVYAGSQYIATSLAKTLFDFRDKKIVNVFSADVDAISFQSGTGKPIEFSKKDGKWLITSPESTEADTTQTNNFLDDVAAIRATEFVDNPTKEQKDLFKGKGVLAVIKLSGAKIGSTELKFATDKSGSTFASLDPEKQIAKVGDDVKSKFSKTLNDFRNKKIFDFQSAQVEAAELDGKAFNRVKDEWYQKDDASKLDKDGKFSGKDSDKPQPASHIRSLLVDLEYAKADAVFGSDSELVKNLPASPKNRIKLEFAADSNRPPVTIDIWQAGDNPDDVIIRPSGSDKVFKAKRSVIASMSPAPVLPADEATFQPPAESPPPIDGNNP